MTRRLVTGTKDSNGAYITEQVSPPGPAPLPSDVITDISIDSLLNRGLRAIYGLMRAIETDIGTGAPSRETVQNLKDALGMLKDLKKDEKDLLDELSDEQLEKMANDSFRKVNSKSSK
jgi:hypothetical protein